jgi:RimJ/RimL family protein N-acetyltransferase
MPMLQLTPAQVSPELASLFDLSMPTGIRALAVLAGGNAGKIFTDNLSNPTWAFVWEADDGTLYRGGSYSRKNLSEAVARLRAEGLVALGFRDDTPDVGLFPPGPTAGADCLEFERPIGANDLSHYLGELPAGYSLRRMDRALLERSPKREENLNRYGRLDNFLDKGLAVCILHGDEIVSEAYADMEIQGVREIGIRTREGYRRQGLAARACVHLIRWCENAGSSTYWDCAKLNAGSVALARKLGFQNEKAYRLLAWFPKEEFLERT